MCATLKQNDATPIAGGFRGEDGVDQAMLWFDYLNIRINGLEFRNDLILEGQVRLDDPRVRDVFATWQPLLEDGYFPEDPRGEFPSQSFLSVLDGGAAMTLASQDVILESVPEARWDELDFFPFPVIDPDVPLGEAPVIEGFVIPANAPEPRAAIDFLAYQGSAEAQTYWAEHCGPLGGIPVRSDVDSTVFTPAMQKAQEMLQNADELSQIIYWLWDSPLLGPVFGGSLFPSFFADPGSLDEIVNKMEAIRQEVFEE